MQGQVPEQADEVRNDLAGDDWNDADTLLRGVRAGIHQDEQQGFAGIDDVYDGQRWLDRGQSACIPPHIKPFSGYGQVFGGRGVGF